jgi:hypothetical protein
MNAPQIIMICLLFGDFLISVIKNGEPRKGKYSVGISIVSIAVYTGILIWGGFF